VKRRSVVEKTESKVKWGIGMAKSKKPKMKFEEKFEREMNRRKEAGTPLIAKSRYESVVQHRAFLLWAMQVPTNFASVSRNFNKTTPGIRHWSQRFRWEDRIPSGDNVAVEMRAYYMSIYGEQFGTRELENIGISSEQEKAPKTKELVGKVDELIKKTPVDPDKLRDRKLRDRHLTAIDASIAYLMKGVKDGTVRRSLRDLPMLIKLREELSTDNNKGGGVQFVVESLRVRQAKANGTDVVEAMYEDAEELFVILKNLKGTGKAQQEIHSVRDEGGTA